MNTVYVIKRDVDCNGKPVNDMWTFWSGSGFGGQCWTWQGACQKYATRKQAESAMKRNTKRGEWTFKRGYAYIVEIEQS